MTTGSKSFNCPLCKKVQIKQNAKRHLIKCSEGTIVVDQEKRLRIAQEIKDNRFVMCHSHLKSAIQILPSNDALSIKILFYALGGILLNEEFLPMSLLRATEV